MINKKLKSHEASLHQLLTGLIKNSTGKWQLMSMSALSQDKKLILKNIQTNRIYEFIENAHLSKQPYVKAQTLMFNCDEPALPNHRDQIFMDFIYLSPIYSMRQYHSGTLKTSLQRNKQLQDGWKPTEQQLLNTFTPILESVARNQIPSFYKITSQSIQVDWQHNIRLAPCLMEPPQQNRDQSIDIQDKQPNHYHQLAIVILQTIFNCQDIRSHLSFNLSTGSLACSSAQQRIVFILDRLGYSPSIIGLIIVLLNQNQNLLTAKIAYYLQKQICAQWLQMIASQYLKFETNQFQNIQRLEQNNYRNKEDAIKTIKKDEKRNRPKQDEQTEDSQNLKVVKYRGGKRVIFNRKANKLQELPCRQRIQTSWKKTNQSKQKPTKL